MPVSVFIDKNNIPTEQDIEVALGERYPLWTTIRSAAANTGKVEKEGWHFSGLKHGWNYRISDKKRGIVYLLPRQAYFKVAFVFGEKAVDAIVESTIDPAIIQELLAAKKYAEGRGIRMDINNELDVQNVLLLLDIKNSF